MTGENTKVQGMKTITFYSFKGGTGRSLASAQLAVCLARLGKTVCVLDFDFEAPGLPYKFSSVAEDYSKWYGKGAARYILNFAKEARLEHLTRVLEMESIKGPEIKIRSGVSEKGIIHVLPAGSVLEPDKQCFRDILDPDFQDFMLQRSGPTIEFFKRLQVQIRSELEPRPDFLIIDSRSGVNEYSGICTGSWPIPPLSSSA